MRSQKPKQLSFETPAFAAQKRLEHGGSLRHGHRKLSRPIDPKRPIHLVLRSSRARGEWSMLRARNAREIQRQVYRLASRFGIKVYRFANSGNHLHLLVLPKKREAFQNYLRTLSALVSRLVTGARRGNPVGKFWDALAYTRVLGWGREFFHAKHYVILNEVEALGIFKRPVKRRTRGSPSLPET